jgi:hypothetical protein
MAVYRRGCGGSAAATRHQTQAPAHHIPSEVAGGYPIDIVYPEIRPEGAKFLDFLDEGAEVIRQVCGVDPAETPVMIWGDSSGKRRASARRKPTW